MSNLEFQSRLIFELINAPQTKISQNKVSNMLGVHQAPHLAALKDVLGVVMTKQISKDKSQSFPYERCIVVRSPTNLRVLHEMLDQSRAQTCSLFDGRLAAAGSLCFLYGTLDERFGYLMWI